MTYPLFREGTGARTMRTSSRWPWRGPVAPWSLVRPASRTSIGAPPRRFFLPGASRRSSHLLRLEMPDAGSSLPSLGPPLWIPKVTVFLDSSSRFSWDHMSPFSRRDSFGRPAVEARTLPFEGPALDQCRCGAGSSTHGPHDLPGTSPILRFGGPRLSCFSRRTDTGLGVWFPHFTARGPALAGGQPATQAVAAHPFNELELSTAATSGGRATACPSGLS